MAATVRYPLSVFSLVMLNVVAIDSLRSLPFAAKYGFSSVFFYIIAALLFFIPSALVAAELATGWPKKGGVYIWVREAFGLQAGLVTIWLQWIYNIFWFPAILSLLAATLAYIVNPALAHSKPFMVSAIMIMFLGTTAVNSLGVYASNWVTNIASLFGSIIPMVLIVILGVVWWGSGQPVHVTFDWHHFWPHVSGLGGLVLLTNVLFSLVGMEMSAIHASEVKNPQRSYPRALLWSIIIILITLIGGSLGIAMVIPQHKIALMDGMLQMFATFFHTFHMPWMIDVIAACIILGGFGGVTAWVLGPSKALMVAAKDGILPKWLSRQNRFHAPISVLSVQLVIFILICGIYWYMPTVSSSFWLLSNITAILSLLAYLFMFASVIRLRYKAPEVKRPFVIPGGKVGLWLVGVAGFLVCGVVAVIGFWPPSNVEVGSVWHYEIILVSGVIIFCIIPFVLYRLCHKKN